MATWPKNPANEQLPGDESEFEIICFAPNAFSVNITFPKANNLEFCVGSKNGHYFFFRQKLTLEKCFIWQVVLGWWQSSFSDCSNLWRCRKSSFMIGLWAYSHYDVPLVCGCDSGSEQLLHIVKVMAMCNLLSQLLESKVNREASRNLQAMVMRCHTYQPWFV